MSALPSVMLAKKEKMAKLLPLEPVASAPVEPAKPVAVQPVRSEPAKPDAPPTQELTPEEVKAFSVDSEAPVASTDPAPVVKPVTPTQEAAPIDWKEAARVHEERYKALHGIHDGVVAENRDLRKQLTDLDEKVTKLSAPKPVVVNDASLDLTPEETEAYSAAIPVVDKLATKKAKQLIEEIVAPLQKEISELKTNNQNVVKQFAASDESSFIQRVKSEVKDFDNITKTPQWVEFTSKSVSPYTKKTIGEALMEAHAQRDLDVVSKVFTDFSASQGNNASAAYHAPSVSPSSAPLPNSGKKPILKFSERAKISEDFRKGRITPKKYQEAKAIFDEANAEGRIDFNK